MNIIVKLVYNGRYFNNIILVKYENFNGNENKYNNLLIENRKNGTYNGDNIEIKYYQTDDDYNFILNEIFPLDKSKIINL